MEYTHVEYQNNVDLQLYDEKNHMCICALQLSENMESVSELLEGWP